MALVKIQTDSVIPITTPFSHMLIGELFRFQDTLHMKLFNGGGFNAFSFDQYHCVEFSDEKEVLPVNGKLVVEK